MYWFISILGLALAVAPFVLDYSANTAAVWSSIVLGLLVALAAGYKAVTKDAAKWENYVVEIAGALAALAPFILGFSEINAAMWSGMILGVLAAALAMYQGCLREDAGSPSAQHGHA